MDPTQRGERKLAQLLRRVLQGPAREVERLVQVLVHLGQVVGHLVVGDALREVRPALVQQAASDLVSLQVLPLAAQRLDQGRVGRRAQHLAGIRIEHALGQLTDLLTAVEPETRQGVGHQQGRIVRIEREGLAVAAQRLRRVAGADRLLAAAHPVGSRRTGRRQLGAGPAREVGDQIAVAHPPRVQLLSGAERGQGLAVPAPVQVAETEEVMAFLERGVDLHRLPEGFDRRREPAHLVAAATEQVERLRHPVDLDRAFQESHRRLQLPPARQRRPEAEVREEGVPMEDDRLLQQFLTALFLTLLKTDHAAVDQTLDMVRLGRQHTAEVVERPLQASFLEVRLAEEVRQLVIAAVDHGRRLEGFHRLGQVEAAQSDLRLVEKLFEAGAAPTLVEPDDPVLDSREPLPLLEHQELVVHLGLPEIAPLGGVDQLLAFKKIAKGKHAGVVDENALLLPVHGAQDLLHGFARAFEHLLEDRDALQKVLVERELLVANIQRLRRRHGGAGEHHQLLSAALAVLRVVPVLRAAYLAVHRG